MKTAEEEALEMVPEPVPFLNEWQVCMGNFALHTSVLKPNMVDYADGVRARLAALISRSRAEGAAAERERLAAHAERPAEEVAKSLVCGAARVSDTEYGAMVSDHIFAVDLPRRSSLAEAADDVDELRKIFSRLIARERAAAYAKGAMEDKERSVMWIRERADFYGNPMIIQALRDLADDIARTA